jgi:hypothetical protein
MQVRGGSGPNDRCTRSQTRHEELCPRSHDHRPAHSDQGIALLYTSGPRHAGVEFFTAPYHCSLSGTIERVGTRV